MNIDIEHYNEGHLDGVIAVKIAEGWTSLTEDRERAHRVFTAPGVVNVVSTLPIRYGLLVQPMARALASWRSTRMASTSYSLCRMCCIFRVSRRRGSTASSPAQIPSAVDTSTLAQRPSGLAILASTNAPMHNAGSVVVDGSKTLGVGR